MCRKLGFLARAGRESRLDSAIGMVPPQKDRTVPPPIPSAKRLPCSAKFGLMAQSVLFKRLIDLTRGSEALLKALFTDNWIQEVGLVQRVGSAGRSEMRIDSLWDPSRSRSSMPDFSTITERAGDPVPQWQIDQMHHRYAWAAQFCRGKDVIASLPFKEASCG